MTDKINKNHRTKRRNRGRNNGCGKEIKGNQQNNHKKSQFCRKRIRVFNKYASLKQ